MYSITILAAHKVLTIDPQTFFNVHVQSWYTILEKTSLMDVALDHSQILSRYISRPHRIAHSSSGGRARARETGSRLQFYREKL